MLYYIIFGIILATILLTLFLELVHSSREKFKKNLKFLSFIIIVGIIIIIMSKFPKIISLIPAIFLIIYRWRFVIEILSKILFIRQRKKKHSSKLDKIQALEILGLSEKASKTEILKKYQDLMKKNHPDKGGSEWITKKLNQARETLLS